MANFDPILKIRAPTCLIWPTELIHINFSRFGSIFAISDFLTKFENDPVLTFFKGTPIIQKRTNLILTRSGPIYTHQISSETVLEPLVNTYTNIRTYWNWQKIVSKIENFNFPKCSILLQSCSNPVFYTPWVLTNSPKWVLPGSDHFSNFRILETFTILYPVLTKFNYTLCPL